MKGIGAAWSPVPSKASIWTNVAFTVIYAALAVFNFATHDPFYGWVWTAYAVLWVGLIAQSIRWRKQTMKAIAEIHELEARMAKERDAWDELVRHYQNEGQG